MIRLQLAVHVLGLSRGVKVFEVSGEFEGLGWTFDVPNAQTMNNTPCPITKITHLN